jgi:hypothetical protein
VSKISGKDMELYALTDFRQEKPHYWFTEAPADLSHASFVDGNLTQLGRLVSAVGIQAAEAKAKEFGVTLQDVYRGKRGVAPNGAAGPAAPKKSSAPNPWGSGPGEWNVTAQGAYIKARGFVEAQKAARAAGSTVGATRPGKCRMLIPRGK